MSSARELIEKYLQNTLSAEEREELLRITEDADNDALAELFHSMLAEEVAAPVDEERLRWSLQRVLAVDRPGISGQVADARAGDANTHAPAADTQVPEAPAHTRVLKAPWLRYAAAAVILIAAAGAYIWQKNKPTVHSPVAAVPVKTGAPGGQKAVLTLADGTAITLDSTASGQLATQQGSRVLNSNGQVTYAPTGDQQDVAAFNTLRTARGGTYRLTLSDGTTVWLNAASSISYPVVFTGKERMVEMTGEAYFEVAPHAQMPFRVKVNDKHLVEVLGTQFNVKAYAEEALVSTTLLQGAVRVAGKVTLKPGQQAQAAGQQVLVKTLGKAGIAQAIAWKEGRFNFQDVHLREVMRQLSRWYDIEVVYENGVPDLEFIGEIERSLPLTEVLKGLKMSGVNFRLEDGKRLVVSP